MCSDSITTPLTFFIFQHFCVLSFAWLHACDARLPLIAVWWDVDDDDEGDDIWHFGHRIHTDYDVLTRGRTVWNVVKPCYDFMDLESRKYRFIMTITCVLTRLPYLSPCVRYRGSVKKATSLIPKMFICSFSSFCSLRVCQIHNFIQFLC